MDPRQNATRLRDCNPGEKIVTYISKKFAPTKYMIGWFMFQIDKHTSNITLVKYIYSDSPHDRINANNLGLRLKCHIWVAKIKPRTHDWQTFLQTDIARWMKKANKRGAK